MKTVVIGIGSGATMEALMAVYPRHKAEVDTFIVRGEVIGVGPFADKGGNLAIFECDLSGFPDSCRVTPVTRALHSELSE